MASDAQVNNNINVKLVHISFNSISFHRLVHHNVLVVCYFHVSRKLTEHFITVVNSYIIMSMKYYHWLGHLFVMQLIFC